MQVKYIFFLTVSLIFCCFCSLNYFLLEYESVFSQSKSKDTLYSANRNSKFKSPSDTIPDYEILLGKDCVKKPKCYIYLVLDKDDINKNNLINLIDHLKSQRKSRKILNIAMFDNAEVVKQYLSGKREIREVDNDVIGVYLFEKNKESFKVKLNNASKWEVLF